MARYRFPNASDQREFTDGLLDADIEFHVDGYDDDVVPFRDGLQTRSP